MLRRPLAAMAALALLAAGCGSLPGEEPSAGPTPAATPTSSESGLDTDAAEDLGALAEEIAGEQDDRAEDSDTGTSGEPLPQVAPRVLVISIDGLASSVIAKDRTPAIFRLFVRGAGTPNARTAVELTETLPNHACMITGRRIRANAGGHGVNWNTDTDELIRPRVSSVFEVVADGGGSSALIAGKDKFDIFRDSWPGSIARFAVEPNMDRSADLVLTELRSTDRDLVFWHLPGPDKAGHAHGWGSEWYRTQVGYADTAVGTVIDAITEDIELRAAVTVILTSDHGGIDGTRSHLQKRHHQNYTVPFVVWGPGVQAGDLYGLNPDRHDPGTGRPPYDGPQPVRNCEVANLATELLGLPPVPGSQLNADQELALAE